MYAYCLNDPVNRTDVGGYKSFRNDEDNDGIDESTEDITGGGGFYCYYVDLSMASRSPIMSGGVHNYGYVHYSYYAPVYGNGGGNSSTVGGAASSTALTTYYPPNNGVVSGTTKYVYLQPGTAIDRYGKLDGNYFAPTGTPLEMRALPPHTDVSQYSSFVVKKPFIVEMGITAPAFLQIGLGVQYYSIMSTKTLLECKIICRAE